MMQKWLRRKQEEKIDLTVELTVESSVENVRIEVENVENVRKLTVENRDKDPDNMKGGSRGIKEVMKRFEEKGNKTDSYEEWKRRKAYSNAKRKVEQVDSEEEQELVMAGKPKRLKNISKPTRGPPIIENLNLENFIAPTCPSMGGGGQVDRAGAVGGGSGGISANEATCAEQRAGAGVRQNLQIED